MRNLNIKRTKKNKDYGTNNKRIFTRSRTYNRNNYNNNFIDMEIIVSKISDDKQQACWYHGVIAVKGQHKIEVVGEMIGDIKNCKTDMDLIRAWDTGNLTDYKEFAVGEWLGVGYDEAIEVLNKL